MSTEAEAYFRALAERGLARAKAAPSLEAIESRAAQGWLLRFSLAGEQSVSIDARPERDRLRFAYRKPAAGPHQAKLERAGLLLCRALTQAQVGRVPPALEPERTIEPPPDEVEVKREGLWLYLPGQCDRGCSFCTIHLQMPEVEDAPGLGDRVRARLGLPMVREREPDFRGQLIARLHEHAERAHEVQIAWSGQDCLSSPIFDELLSLAHELGYRDMTVQTPGTRLLEPGFLDRLAAHSICGIGLTAHAADNAEFDRIGGKAGAAELFWTTLEVLDEREFEVSVEVPLIADTAAGLAELVPRLLEHRCGATVFYWYPEAEVTEHFGRLSLPFDEAIAALERLRERVPAGRVGLDGIPPCVAPTSLTAHFHWLYGRHMDSAATESLPLCRTCALVESCPGAATVYRETYGWPSSARPLS